MKKINVCLTAAALLAAGMSSAFAAQDPTTSVLTISGTITGGTCVIGLPAATATIPDIQQAAYEAAGAGTQLGSDVSVGNITLTHCNSNTVTVSAKALNLGTSAATHGTFKYANTAAGTKNPLYYTLGYKNGTSPIADFNLVGTTPASFSVSSDNLTIPVTLKTMKNGATIPDIGKYTGTFSATVAYTASYK